MIGRHKILVMNFLALVGVDDVHQQGGEDLYHKKLHHPLLATVSKILGLFPVG